MVVTGVRFLRRCLSFGIVLSLLISLFSFLMIHTAIFGVELNVDFNEYGIVAQSLAEYYGKSDLLSSLGKTKTFRSYNNVLRGRGVAIPSVRDTRNFHDVSNNNHNYENIDSGGGVDNAASANSKSIPSGYDTMSACLLVMDDNPRLIEWLAYHYHVLPLRYLVIAADPRSYTSPTAILNRWREKAEDPMIILEWNDTNFFLDNPNLAKKTLPPNATFQNKRDRHRSRQKNFYRQCTKHMYYANRTYVIYTDTDEFLTYNHPGGNLESFQKWEREKQQLSDRRHPNRKRKRVQPFQIPPPSTYEKSSMLRYIRKEKEAGHPFFSKPCITVPRLHFSAVESTEEEVSNMNIGIHENNENNRIIDPTKLDTLRYRYHTKRDDYTKNMLAKVIMDVSNFPMPIEKIPRFQSLHRPIPKICGAPWSDDDVSSLRINHYIGSWEAYSHRKNDARKGGYERSYETWLFTSQETDETDDNIRPWISGFLSSNSGGGDDAKEPLELLRNVGDYDIYKEDSATNNNDTFDFMHIDTILAYGEKLDEGSTDKNRIEFHKFLRELYKDANRTSGGENKAKDTSDAYMRMLIKTHDEQQKLQKQEQ